MLNQQNNDWAGGRGRGDIRNNIERKESRI